VEKKEVPFGGLGMGKERRGVAKVLV